MGFRINLLRIIKEDYNDNNYKLVYKKNRIKKTKNACFKLTLSKISQVFNNSSLKENWEYNLKKFNIQFKI